MSDFTPLKNRLLYGFLGTTVAAGLVAVPAMAQDSDPGSSVRTLQTVTVTARKKEESLQDVPVAVAAVSGETIEAYGLDEIDEMGDRIPNLRIQSGGSGAGGGIYFRGIGANFNAGAFEPSLALSVDGAVVSSARVLQNSFFDLESFEVLKGPQALYFGKAATAGVLSLRTKNPTDEFEAIGGVAYEFEHESTIADVIISGPITDTLGARLAARVKNTENLWENVAQGVANPERGEESVDYRLTLDWNPTDKLNVNLKYTDLSYENDGPNGGFRIIETDFLLPGPDDPRPPANAGTPAQTGGFIQGVGEGQIGTADVPILALGGASEYLNGGVPFSENDTTFLNIKASYDISDDYRVIGTFGWTDIEDTGMDNYTQAYDGGGTSGSLNEFDFKTYEVRIEGDPTDAFSFMAGAFYEDSNQFFDAEQYLGFGAFGAGALGVLPTTPGFETAFHDIRKIHDTDTTIASLFASFDVELTEKLSLTAGLRYTDVEKEGTVSVPYVHDFLTDLGTNNAYADAFAALLFGLPPVVDPGAPNPAFGGASPRQIVQGLFGGSADTRNGTFVTPVIEYEDDDINFEGTINYEIFPDQNVYFAYKQAFKPGGIDNSATAWNSVIPSVTSAGEGLVFQGESVDGFEIGYKSELLNNSLRLNGVFYNYDYSDFQIQSFNAAALSFVTTNAGEVKSQGIEVDFEYLPAIDGLTVNGSLAWDNSEFEEFTDPVSGHILDGRRLGLVAEWTGNVGLDYRNTFAGSDWGYSFGYNMRFSDEFIGFNQYSGNCGGCPTTGLQDVGQDAYAVHDLRLGVNSPDDRWSVDLIANNIADEHYIVAGAGVAPGTGVDDQNAAQNEGRTITIRLGARY